MTLQTFVPYIPFLALLYALFALIQALRHQRQGVAALVLALIGIAAPLIAYVLNSDMAISASLINAIFVNAVIVFAASLLTLWIERRNQKRDPKRSYGMVGIGLSILLMASMFILPFATSSTASANPPMAFSDTTSTTTTATNSSSGDFVLVSADQSSSAFNQSADTAAAAAPANLTGDSSVQPQATEAVTEPAAFPTNTPAAPIQSAVATEMTSESTVRPTPISFPEAQPTEAPTLEIPDAVVADAAATASDSSAAATCSLMVDYNLNLRDQPTTEGSNVYLSIPFGTAVTAEAATSDGWYKVTYSGYTGWISGDYVTAQTSCAALS